MIDSLETKFYVVLSDLTYKEVKSINDGFKSRPTPIFAVKKENKGKTLSLFDKNDFYAHSKYSLYDSNLNNFQINESDWILIGINEKQDRSRCVIYQISDPKGELRNISSVMLWAWSKLEYFQIAGICNVIAYMRYLSKFPDWTYHDIVTENEKLRENNKELIGRISKLEDNLNEILKGQK